MSYPLHIVDAFTSELFKGNPAAVCLLPAFPNDTVMQQIAMEMNQAETAFLTNHARLEYNLRWFTPVTEVSLCGHATLAATHILLQTEQIQPGDSVVFHTRSGALRARADSDAIELDFPALPGKKAFVTDALHALRVGMHACEKNRDNYLVEVADYDELLACAPDFTLLKTADAEGVIVTTAKGSPAGFDFASRYFAPQVGIDEDAVTGSAHCFLAAYWAERLGKNSFTALQASKRTGVLGVALRGDRVLLTGQAVTTLSGQLHVPLSLAEMKEIAA